MAGIKEKMQRARELISAKRYDEARAILRTVDHDKAYEWLDKLDKIAPAKPTFAPPDLLTPAVVSKGKNPVKSQSVTVSSRALFGKSQMDKAIEKYTSQGWELVKQSEVGKNRFLLRFEYELSDIEAAREQAGRRNRLIVGAILLTLCGSYSLYLSGQGRPEREATATQEVLAGQTQAVVQQATDAVQSTQDTFATQTATLWTQIPTATITPTSTITQTSTPAPTATITNTSPPPTITPTPTPNDGLDAMRIESAIWDFTDVDVRSVQVANGRPNGGERAVIITYVSTAAIQADLMSEWGSIFGAVGSVVRERNIDIDSLGIVVGDVDGAAVGTVSAQIDDILSFMDGTLTAEQFFLRLTIVDF